MLTTYLRKILVNKYGYSSDCFQTVPREEVRIRIREIRGLTDASVAVLICFCWNSELA